MSTRRKPKAAAEAPRLTLKAVAIVVAVAAVAVPVAVLAARAVLADRGDFDTTIREAGFYPIAPPSKLVMPGSIYQVSKDGRFYTTICRADDADVVPVTQVSETQEVAANLVEGGTFDLDAKAAGEINARLNGNLVRAVQYTLRDVAVLEIPLDRNEEVFVKLTSRESCKEAVRKLLEWGELVCQGQAVLRATVEYRLVTSGSVEAVAELLDTAIKSALEGALKTSVSFDDGRLVSGVGLHYGVRVNPICVTLPTDDAPRHLPPARSAQVAMLGP
jgi:hypothetical protein